MQLLEVLCTITLLLSLLEQSASVQRRTCPNLSLPNGRVRMRDRDREAHFECKKNYTRLGDATAVCRGSNTWSHPTPICISRGCPPLGALPQIKVKKSYNGALFKFTCPVGTERTGPEVITCDGREWSEDPPTCNSRKCPKLSLPNGRVMMPRGGWRAKFKCKKRYTILGDKSSECRSNTWSHPTPICISRGCPPLGALPQMKVKKSYNGALLKFTCPVGTERTGPEVITCDGREWSEDPPTCNSINTMECDFEKGICGWGQDTFDNFEWTRMSGATSTRGTGPPGDHTTGSGFYLFMKSSSPRKAGDTARLISPEYPPTLRNMCFEFWYHTKGPSNDDAVGSLEIYILPYTANIEESEPKFYHHRNQGNEWHRGLVKIPDHDHKFKIVIVGTRKGAYASDIAIDDLRMFNCSEVTTTTMQTTTTTTKRATRMTVKTGWKCPKLSLTNGRVMMRRRGMMAKFKCKKGYTILGDKSSECRSNTWSHPTPICISRGCPPLGALPQMEVEKSYNGALLKFTCPVGTERTGPEVITCDGREWSEDPPTCNMTTITTQTTTTKRATSMTVKTGITDSVMTADRVNSTTSPASTREMAKNVTIEIVPSGKTTLPVPTTTTAKSVTTSSVGLTTTTVVTTFQTTPTMTSTSATSTTSTTTKMTTPKRQTSTVRSSEKPSSNTKAPTVTMTSTPSTQRATSTSTSSAVTSLYSFTSKAKTNGTVTTHEVTTTMMQTTTTKRATSMTVKTGITDSVMTADRVRSTTSPASTREMAKNVAMEIVPSGKATLPVPTTTTAKSVTTSSVGPTTTAVFTTLQTTPTTTSTSATSTTSTTTKMTTPQRQTSTVGSSAKLSTNTKAPTVTMTSTPATSTTSAPTSPQRPTSTSTSSAVTSVYSFTSETKTNATNGNTTHEGGTCPKLSLPNGHVEMQGRGNFAYFKCKKRYTILGDTFAVCRSSNMWSHPTPICVLTTTMMQTTTTKRATSMTVKTGITDSVMTADRVRSTTSPASTREMAKNVAMEIVPSGKATLPVPTTTTAKSVTTSSVGPTTTAVFTTLQTTPTTTSTSATSTTSTTTKMTTPQRQTSTVGSSAKLSTNTKAPTVTMTSTPATSTTSAPTSPQRPTSTSTSSAVTSVYSFTSETKTNATNGNTTHEATTTTMQTPTSKRAASMTVKTGITDSVMTADRVSSTTSPDVQNVAIEIVPSGKTTLPGSTTTTAKPVTTSSVAPITTTVLTTLQTTPTTTSTSATSTTSTTTKMTTQQRQTSTVGSSALLSTNAKAPTATMMSTLVTSTTTAPTSTQRRKPTSTSSTVTSVFNFSSMAQPNVTNGKVPAYKGEFHVTHRLHSMSPRPDGNIKSSGDDDHFTGTIENDITTPSTSGKGTTSTIPPVVPAVADVRNPYKASGGRVMSLIIWISAGIIMGMIVTDILSWLWTRNQRRNKDPENAEDELNMHTTSDAAIKNT